MRQTQRTIAAMIGATGLALGASAQEECSKSSECKETKSSSCTTISATGDGGSYEIRMENGELVVVKVDGKNIDPDECDFDQEAGTLVLERDGESFIVQIPGGAGGALATAPIAISRGNAFFPGQGGLVAPDAPDTPSLIEWADAPDLPGTIFYDDGTQSSWAFEGDEPPRVMIGITHDEVDEEHRDMFDLDEGEGIFIIDVRDGLPADEAGVKSGDVIIEVDGEFIDEREVLGDILEDREPGDKLKVVVLRMDDDGDVIKKKLRINLDEYNGFVLRGGEGRGLADFPDGGDWLGGDGEDFEFPEELAFFDDFEFEMPEGIDELPEDVRDEVMRALEMARERAHDTQSRAFRLRVDRDDHRRALEQYERAARSNQRAAQGISRQLERTERDNQRHNEHLENLHEHLGQLRGLTLDEESLANLREHGVDIQIQMGDEFENLRELGLRLHELGGNEQIIRSAPNGRAFIIERELHPDANGQARQNQDRSNELRLRVERDSLLDRNRSLEDRVEALERRLAELMERLEKSDR